MKGKSAGLPAGQISSLSCRHPSVRLGENVGIGAFSSVGAHSSIGCGSRLHENVSVGADVHIGRNCRIRPQVVLYDGVRIGDNCEIHSGSVIGADCYGHEDKGEALVKPPVNGRVVIGNDVEIGANCSIERGQHGDTRIGDYAKIGDLVVIAHDCRLGLRCRLTAQVGLASNVTLGDDVMLMGQVGVRGGAIIGDRVVVFAKSAVYGDLDGDCQYLGSPARPHREALRAMAAVRRMPKLLQRILKLEERHLAVPLDRQGGGR